VPRGATGDPPIPALSEPSVFPDNGFGGGAGTPRHRASTGHPVPARSAERWLDSARLSVLYHQRLTTGRAAMNRVPSAEVYELRMNGSPIAPPTGGGLLRGSGSGCTYFFARSAIFWSPSLRMICRGSCRYSARRRSPTTPRGI